MKKKGLGGIFIFILLVQQLYADPLKTTSKLESVNLFRLGAELTHTAKIYLPQGNNEVLIEGLSADVDINSIQIKSSGNATLMATEFSKDYLKTGTDSKTKKIKDSITIYEKELARVQAKINTNKELGELLRANKTIAGSQNGLSVLELSKMMDYYKTKSLELENERATLNEDLEETKQKLQTLKLQLEIDSRKNDKVSGQLSLQLICPTAGNYTFTVSYYTRSAGWNPYYDLNIANAESGNISISYKAKVLQTTGLDWKKVNLSLSTALPNSNKTAPVFNTWFLDYMEDYTINIRSNSNSRKQLMQNSIQSFSMEPVYAQNEISEEMILGDMAQGSSSTPLYVVNGQIMEEWEANTIDPNLIRNVEILNNESAISMYGSRAANGVVIITLKNSLEDFITESESSIDISYDIDLKYDILGNGTEQLIVLKEQTLPTVYKYYVAPKLDQSAYLLAEISGWEKLNLLPGEANVTFEGTYLGKSFIDPSSTQNTLNLTLNEDKRIIVKREKLQDFSKTKTFDKDKKQEFSYKITVKNTKRTPANMILKDQYPISMQKGIEVEVIEISNAAVNEEVGVLTWMFTLEPGETKEVLIKYTVKYPKDKKINL
ncbi:MAG: mucoidy inhibitor MuiA family protein [Candidatus Azobacteroides sp.]|nr:mucoidy inhibitor MuiA family protein [Candidatus Azobacteroides sp.]